MTRVSTTKFHLLPIGKAIREYGGPIVEQWSIQKIENLVFNKRRHTRESIPLLIETGPQKLVN